MKKLMIALAAAATTMFSFGAGTETAENRETLVKGATGTSFEALAEGSKTVGDIVDKDDEGATVGAYYWYSTAPVADELGAITNDVASGVSRPDLFANQNQANTKSLQIDTTAPLVRTALPNAGASSVSPVDIGDGIYLDTLVKFTAAEEGFTTNSLTAGDKIAIEYVEHGADALNEAEPDTYTNFVIRAGLIGAELGQTNYYAYVSGDPDFTNFDKDEWHRLTVRTIADVGDGNVGFVIYLDGDMTKTLEYSKNVDAGFGTLNALAQTFYNSEKHALFPSAIAAEDIGGSTISSVAFSGNGFIDDVSFTATKPTFINEAILVTIAWDEHVTGMEINGTTLTAEQVEAMSWTGEPNEGSVVAIPTFAEGYVAGAPELPEGATYNSETKTFGNLTSGMTCTIKSMFPYYEVNGVSFDDLDAAIEAAEAGTAQNPATFKLLANCAEMIKFTSGYVVLDLAGYDIQGTDEQAFSVVCQGAHMIVTNSVPATGAVKRPVESEDTAGAMQVKGDDGAVAVYVAKFDDIISVKPDSVEKTAIFVIYSGTFIDEDAGNDPDAFAYNVYVQNGATVTSLGNNYFQVGTAAPQPTTFALTTTGGANATVTTNPADVSALTEETEVTITATPETGYTYNGVDLTDTGFTYDSESGTISRTLIVTTDTEVAVPGAVAQQLGTYTVTVTPTANATYAAVYKVGGETITPANDVLTVTVGQTIVITATPAEGYEYAETPTDWTAGQDGEITIEVSEAGTVAIPAPTEKGGKTYPSYIDDTEKTKYDTWAAYAEISAADFPDATGSNQEAYLLNCKPSEVADAKAAFKFTSISYDTTQSKWVTATTTSYNERGYNGEVVVKQYSDVGCKTESSTGTFFKAFLQ